MPELSDSIISNKKELRDLVASIYGGDDLPLTRENFRSELWRALANVVHYNKHNPLIQHAVREYPTLICRAYSILSIRFGSFCYAPMTKSILFDFIEMLDNDIDEVELAACAYAQSQRGKKVFFPELFVIREMVHTIYNVKYFDTSVLPPTPHHAFAIIANNMPELFSSNMSPEALYGHMQVFARKFDELHVIVESSKTQK